MDGSQRKVKSFQWTERIDDRLEDAQISIINTTSGDS